MADGEGDLKIKQSIYSGYTTVPELPPKVVRIFVSSTFVDAEAERNVLLNEVYPTVWWWCKNNDLDFQLVDMRWGVRDEASTDHTTSQICLREIQKCQNVSMGPNFLFILGQRYGYRPIPATIPASMYGILSEHVTNGDHINLLSSWYLRDDNTVPPVYVLQPIMEQVRKQWSTISDQLVSILRRAASDAGKAGQITEAEKQTFFMSVTEQEVREALDSKNPDDHCVGVLRTITDLEEHLGKTNTSKFCDLDSENRVQGDAKELLGDLKDQYATKRLNEQNIHQFNVKWSPKGVDPSRSDHRTYLDQFSNAVTNNTINLIKNAKTKYTHYELSKDELFIEVCNHAEFCRSKCINFHGCEDIIHAIFEKIKDEKFRKPIAIHGPSGSGKTSIMAMVQENAQKHLGHPCVVVSRFLGTTSQSSTIINVILSIAKQICAAYQIYDSSELIERRPKELFPYFHSLLEKVSSTCDRHLIIMLDSLDQLESAHSAHRCLWLPRNLPPKVSVVVSTLPDMYGILPKLRQLLGNEECFLSVEALSEGTGDEIMHTWMQGIGRAVTEEQKNILKKAFLKCPQPLFLKLLFEEARRWESYTKVKEEDLAVTVREAIWKLFERLERQFGYKLVSHALGYITAARSGLSHAELEDILSIDDEVLDEIYQYWSPVDPTTVRIPSLLWTRLKYELEEYLVERQADGRVVMVLYHRQFKEAAEARYLNDPEIARQRYQVLADFFEARWSDKPKTLVLTQRHETLQAYRKVASQPLRFDKEFNQRKISELPYSLLFAKDIPRFVESTFGNFEFILTSMLANSTQYVIEELSWALTYPNILGSEVCTQLGLLQDTLRLAKPTLEFKNNTQPVAIELLGRLSYFEGQYPDLIGRVIAGCRTWCQDTNKLLLIPQMSFFPTPGGPMRTTLIGHHGDICDLSISDDGRYLATSDTEGAVYIWELGLDELLYSVKDIQGKPVSHVTFSHDNRWFVGYIKESRAIQVWNMQSGDPSSRIVIDSKTDDLGKRDDHQTCIILPESSETILFGAAKEVKIYLIRSGALQHTISVPSGDIKGLCLSSNDQYLHIITQNGHFLTHSMMTYELLFDLHPHEGQVNCITNTELGHVAIGYVDGTFCLIQPDENKNMKGVVALTETVFEQKPVAGLCIKEDLSLLIVAADNNIYVWDYVKKCLQSTLQGHEESIENIEVATESSLLVSGGYDDIIIVWDLISGTKVQVLDGQQSDISLLKRHNNQLASASFNTPYIKLWDISPQYLSQHHHKFIDKKDMAAITKDLQYVVHQQFPEKPTISIWESDAMKSVHLKMRDDETSRVTCFAATDTAQTAIVGCSDGCVVIADLRHKKVLNVLPGDKIAVASIAVRPDERYIAVAYANDTVRVINIQSLKTQRQFDLDVKGNTSNICLTLMDILVVASDAGLVYVKLTSSSDLVKLEGNQSPINCLGVSPDERHVACGMEGANALVWDLQMTRVDLQIRAKSVQHLCFTKDNEYLATTSNDKKVCLWRRSNGNQLLDIYIYSNLSCLAAIEGALIGTTQIGQVVAMEIKDRKKQALKRQTSRTCAIL
ncbi:NACHT domain- and WD repeat-containing protein 1-like [Lytechinus pictus]|uniref:NACHT domain- and WD repeat-containing protein 1-like n=1 Tax=Lytechinus pictus TaxID=7653 RepID=UPI0030BA2130